MLHIHRAERADALAIALAGLMSDPLPDPFEPEVISVPTRGMERWLTQRLSGHLGARRGRGDGICANVLFPFPAKIIGEAVACAAGVDPEEDPWAPERAVWPLLSVVEEAIAEPWLACLAEHLAADAEPEDPRRNRRFSAVRGIAELFDRYAVHRPAMVQAWSEGSDLDGFGKPLHPDDCWQAQLWRELRQKIGVPSPPERVAEACARLREDHELTTLPERISIFGLTRLPPSFLDVLDSLAVQRDVHLFVLHPSPALWNGVRDLDLPARSLPRAADQSGRLVSNRLLASWGQDSRELQLVLGRARDSVEHHHGGGPRRDSLLARIQQGVAQNRASAGEPMPGSPDPRPTLSASDRSIQIHGCHGRGRQVEILRDAILHALEEDPTLEPRDIIVMCPDVETYAPLIQATFGVGGTTRDDDPDGAIANPPPDLRVRLADRSLRETNPLLGVVAALLELPRSRMTASEVLDLADREPVRRRFGFDDDDLARIRDWVAASGIRWGLDAAHRKGYKLQKVPEGTWQVGLDRLLLGVAMADENRLFGGTLPLDDVGSSEIELAGRTSEFIERLGTAVDGLSGQRPAAAWRDSLAGAVASLTHTPDWIGWQRAELSRILDELLGDAQGAPDLGLSEVRALLTGRLAGRPTQANFRTGHLTVCTLVPMRSVPHRVVCVMGLDDGAFPRRSPRNGDDLTIAEPQVGDRDPRLEDRQMLLDALLAAEDRLIITYTSADERTNARRPPAVPLGELLDEIDATVRVAEGRARDQVVVHHPLQPFDPRNFNEREPWSFDRISLDGARALTEPRSERPAFLERPLPALESPVLQLKTLVDFVQRPVRTFIRERLRIYLIDDEVALDDGLTVDPDGLERYSVGENLLKGVLAGRPMADCVAAERARGTLPPGAIGDETLMRILPTVHALSQCVQSMHLDGESDSVEINLSLPGGRRITGTVAGVKGECITFFTYAGLKPRHRIAAWIRLLALTAARPETAWRATVVAKPKGDDYEVAIVGIDPLEASAEGRELIALDLLGGYVDLFDRGMREPLPLPCATAEAYVQASLAGEAAEPAATKAWMGSYRFGGEDQERDHVLAFDGQIAFDELFAHPRRAGEDWYPEEASRFANYSRRLWEPLLQRERRSYR